MRELEKLKVLCTFGRGSMVSQIPGSCLGSAGMLKLQLLLSISLTRSSYD